MKPSILNKPSKKLIEASKFHFRQEVVIKVFLKLQIQLPISKNREMINRKHAYKTTAFIYVDAIQWD